MQIEGTRDASHLTAQRRGASPGHWPHSSASPWLLPRRPQRGDSRPCPCPNSGGSPAAAVIASGAAAVVTSGQTVSGTSASASPPARVTSAGVQASVLVPGGTWTAPVILASRSSIVASGLAADGTGGAVALPTQSVLNGSSLSYALETAGSGRTACGAHRGQCDRGGAGPGPGHNGGQRQTSASRCRWQQHRRPCPDSPAAP